MAYNTQQNMSNRKVIKIKKHSNAFIMFWHLTDFCNYNCSYCPPWLKAGDYHMGRKAGHPTDEEIDSFLHRLETDILKDGRRSHIMLSGGEPTIHKRFGEIVHRLTADMLADVCITTNLSRPLKFWEKLETLPAGMNISLHHETTDMNLVNEKMEFLVPAGVQIQFNLVCNPGNWEKGTMEMFNGLDPKFQKYIHAWPLHDNSEIRNRHIYQYSPEQSKWMKERNMVYRATRKSERSKFKQENSFVYFSDGSTSTIKQVSETAFKQGGQNWFNGWKCRAGQQAIDVNFSGDVWSSVCKFVKLGRIDDFKLLDEPVLCDRDICIHPMDLGLDKIAPGEPEFETWGKLKAS